MPRGLRVGCLRCPTGDLHLYGPLSVIAVFDCVVVMLLCCNLVWLIEDGICVMFSVYLVCMMMLLRWTLGLVQNMYSLVNGLSIEYNASLLCW